MVADTDNKPASPENSATENSTNVTAKVGDGGKVPSPRRLSLPKSKLPFKRIENKRRLTAYALIAVVVIAGGYIVARVFFHAGEKVYAQAAGHKVYKKEVDDLIDNTKGVSVHRAATVLADKYLYQAMAKQAGITVTNKDLVAEFPSANATGTTKIVRQSDINSVYYSKLSAYNAGFYKGEVLVANFSRYIPFQSSLLAERKAENPLIGNQQAIKQDRQYAAGFINNLYNEIKGNKITFNQAIQIERNDPRLGVKAYQELPHSGPFDTSNVFLGGTNLVGPQSAQPQLASMKAGQLSKPFVVSVRNSLTDNGDTVEAYYLVVRMDYTHSSHSGLSFDQYLAKAQKQYAYKVNV